MCELTLQEAGFTQAEIAVIPIRRTWYGIAGTADHVLAPRYLTDSSELAKARALIENTDSPSCGPWHVVVLTENLRAPA